VGGPALFFRGDKIAAHGQRVVAARLESCPWLYDEEWWDRVRALVGVVALALSGVGVVVAVGTTDDESSDSASLLLQLYLTIIAAAAAASPVLPLALYLWRE
jgi:hypothetical protein